MKNIKTKFQLKAKKDLKVHCRDNMNTANSITVLSSVKFRIAGQQKRRINLKEYGKGNAKILLKI